MAKNRLMKTSRLLLYGAAGIIAGLLLENRAMLTRQRVHDKRKQLKNKIDHELYKVREKMHA
jgi:hypothetical protein